MTDFPQEEDHEFGWPGSEASTTLGPVAQQVVVPLAGHGTGEPAAAALVALLRDEGFAAEETRLHRSIDMRYRRQVHILTVPVVADGGAGYGGVTPAGNATHAEGAGPALGS